MKISNFFMKLISGLFVLIFGLLCLTTTLFLLAKDMTSRSSITNYVKTANIFDYKIQDVISKDNNETLRQTIKEDLLNMDIPALVVDDVIDSEEVYQLISDYIYNYSCYILYDNEKPDFSKDNLINIVKQKYFDHEKKQLSNSQIKKLSSYVDQQSERLTKDVIDKTKIDEIAGLNIMRKVVNVFDAEHIPVELLILLAMVFVVVSICLGSIPRGVNWCSKVTMLDGVLLIIASFVEVRVLIMYFNSQGLIDSLAISIIENGFKNMLTYGIILVVVGLIFITISGILLKKEKNKKPERDVERFSVFEDENAAKDIPVQVEDKDEETKIENQTDDVEEKTEGNKQEPITIPKDDLEIKQEDKDNNNDNESKENLNQNNKQDNKPKEVPVQNNNNQNNKPNNGQNNQQQNNQNNKQDNKPKEVPVQNNNNNNQNNKPNNGQNNQSQNNQNNKQDNKPNDDKQNNKSVIEEVKIVPVEEKSIKPVNNNVKNDNNHGDYIELKDEVEETPVVEEGVKIAPLDIVNVNLIHPKKGDDVIITHDEDSEEDIEVL